MNIYIYSLGEFEALEENFLLNKAIIRIHNKNDYKWFSNWEKENSIQLFFNDLKEGQIKWYERILAKYIKKSDCFTCNQANLLINFIEGHSDKDFIIHCQYGRSRSVAVGLYIKEKYNGIIINKTEFKYANDWVLKLLKKVRK